MGCSFSRIWEEPGLDGDLYKTEPLDIIVQHTERGAVTSASLAFPFPEERSH